MGHGSSFLQYNNRFFSLIYWQGVKFHTFIYVRPTRGILATQSVMKGVGVGDTEATPLAATITWVLKDGTGHVGRIAFAWWKGSIHLPNNIFMNETCNIECIFNL